MRKSIMSLLLSVSIIMAGGGNVIAAENDQTMTIEEMQEKIVELEERIAALEDLLLNGDGGISSETEDNSADASRLSTLNPGVYIVGEDIISGKYDFTVKNGIGVIYVYDNYEVYKEDQYGFNEMYQIASQDYLDGIAQNEDVGFIASMMSSKADNVRLEDGMCMYLDSVTVEAEKTE